MTAEELQAHVQELQEASVNAASIKARVGRKSTAKKQAAKADAKKQAAASAANLLKGL